jgi:putative SOS response-associated peptidase YedK
MCGRYLTKDERALERELFLNIRHWPHWAGGYNIAPTQLAPVVIPTADGNAPRTVKITPVAMAGSQTSLNFFKNIRLSMRPSNYPRR